MHKVTSKASLQFRFWDPLKNHPFDTTWKNAWVCLLGMLTKTLGYIKIQNFVWKDAVMIKKLLEDLRILVKLSLKSLVNTQISRVV